MMTFSQYHLKPKALPEPSRPKIEPNAPSCLQTPPGPFLSKEPEGSDYSNPVGRPHVFVKRFILQGAKDR